MTLREALKKRKMTGADLARAIGVQESEVSRWASGSRTPSQKNRIAINAALEEDVFDPRSVARSCPTCGRFIGKKESEHLPDVHPDRHVCSVSPIRCRIDPTPVTPDSVADHHEREQAKKR